MKSESAIQREIRLRMSQLKCICLRQQVGTYFAPDGTIVHIGEKGVSDLIAIVPHTIRPEDVGRQIGVAVALEVKKPGGRIRKEQGPFLRAVNRLGGLGAVVRSAEDAEKVVREKWNCNFVIDYTDKKA